MITIYKILKPYQGTHVDAHSMEELKQKLADEAWSAYLTLTQSTPFSVVTINADGSQIWRSPTGDEIPSPEEVQAMLENYANNTITQFNTES
jgi:flagellar motor protein MotB